MAALPLSALQQRQHKQGHAALVPRSAGQLKAEHDGIVGRAQFFLYATIALAIVGVIAVPATSAQQAAACLVEQANHAGGGDNITAIVLRYAPKQNGAISKIGRWFKASEDPS